VLPDRRRSGIEPGAEHKKINSYRSVFIVDVHCPADNAVYAEPPLRIDGNADRYNHRDGNDDYTQAGDLHRLMSDAAKMRLIDNIVAAMQGVPREIQIRQVGHFLMANPAYGEDVARGLGINPLDIG